MTVTKSQKKDALKFFDEAEAVLKELAEKYGMELSPLKGKYSATNQTLTATFSKVNEEGVAETPEYKAYKLYQKLRGFKEIGSIVTFYAQGGSKVEAKIVGYNTKAHTYPIQVEVLTRGKFAGKIFRLPESYAKA